jgi:hypothetical protein
MKEKERNMLAAYGEKEISRQLNKIAKQKPPVKAVIKEKRMNQDLIHLDHEFGENEASKENVPRDD